jgi:exosortase/archaeosortase family protein
LLLLSLPIIASLQFYLGYPLRCLSAFFVVALLNACGVSVEQEGINLLWLGEVVVVDAPCSGIRMLWGGLYLAFTLSCFQDLSTRQTLMAYSLAGLTVFLGNIIRTALLFCLEANFLSGPAWLHQGIGMTVFVIVAVLIHQEIKTMKGVRDAFVQV